MDADNATISECFSLPERAANWNDAAWDAFLVAVSVEALAYLAHRAAEAQDSTAYQPVREGAADGD
jgi:hypothetical protein